MLAEAISTTFIPHTRSPPTPRAYPLLLKMNNRNSVIIFGGSSESYITNDIWEFSLYSLTWTEIRPLSTEFPSNF